MAKLHYVSIKDLTPKDIASLSVHRRRQAESYRCENDKKLSLAAGVALDKALQEYGLREKDAVMSYERFGKPYLKDYPNIKFSISHSGEIAVVAISDVDVGCDIERTGRYKEEVVERCFSKEEQDFIFSQTDKDAVFTKIWVAKESFVKALGLGLSVKLNSFSVIIKGDQVSLSQNIDPRVWTIKEESLDGYFLAVCEENK